MDLDMSRPGSELFPESSSDYNSYTDVTTDHAVGDPLNTGAAPLDVAGQETSDQQANFRALRDEVAKMKEEREYWKGQAEAFKTHRVEPARSEPTQQQDAYKSLDFDDSKDIRTAFDALRNENQRLRQEMQDTFTALSTKAQRSDWDSMVSQHVPQLTSKNPLFAEMIQKASNPYEAAYLLSELNAKSSQQQESPQPPQNQYGQRAIANASKPQTLATVGGRGQLSAADYYASMSDDDFMKIASKNLANI